MPPTIPAPMQATQPRTPSAIALIRFGTVGFDVYRALVLEEERRLSKARTKRSEP